MTMQKLSNAVKQLSYSFVKNLSLIIGILSFILILPIALISYSYTRLKIRLKEERYKRKEKL
jgi:DMSO/TMAO reductase YedYZ heme-binding membrane subunit